MNFQDLSMFIDVEVKWCRSQPKATGPSPEFRAGYYAAMKQIKTAVRILEKAGRVQEKRENQQKLIP